MITNEKLKEKFIYDENTGVFTNIKTGREIKNKNSHGYVSIWVDRGSYMAHRLAWLYVYGELPKFHIDHINHNRADNRISNLRDVERIENSRNLKLKNTNKSGINGVRMCNQHKKWHAQISINGKNKHLGYFDSIEEAIIARKNAEQQYGFHNNHGALIAS